VVVISGDPTPVEGIGRPHLKAAHSKRSINHQQRYAGGRFPEEPSATSSPTLWRVGPHPLALLAAHAAIETERITASETGRRLTLGLWPAAAQRPPRQFDGQISHQGIQIGVRFGLQPPSRLSSSARPRRPSPGLLLEHRGDPLSLAVPDPDIACRGAILSHDQTLPKWACRAFSPKWPARVCRASVRGWKVAVEAGECTRRDFLGSLVVRKTGTGSITCATNGTNSTSGLHRRQH
jgi:hypothetical protein